MLNMFASQDGARRGTSSRRDFLRVGTLGLGLCSFAVGVSPEEVKRRIDIYREAVERCERPIGKYVHNQAATFTMTLCGDDRDAAIAAARDSFEWYPKTGARHIATVAVKPAFPFGNGRHLLLRQLPTQV